MYYIQETWKYKGHLIIYKIWWSEEENTFLYMSVWIF